MNAYRARHVSAGATNRRGRFEGVMEQLNLSAEQRDQVKAIFDEARVQLTEMRRQSQPRFRAVRAQTDARLRDVLSPDQWEQFQKLTSEFRERRSRRGNRDAEP